MPRAQSPGSAGEGTARASAREAEAVWVGGGARYDAVRVIGAHLLPAPGCSGLASSLRREVHRPRRREVLALLSRRRGGARPMSLARAACAEVRARRTGAKVTRREVWTEDEYTAARSRSSSLSSSSLSLVGPGMSSERRRDVRRGLRLDSCATSGREKLVGAVRGITGGRASLGCSRVSVRTRLEVRVCTQPV